MSKHVCGRLQAFSRLIDSPRAVWTSLHSRALPNELYNEVPSLLVRPFGDASGLRPLHSAASQLLEATHGQHLSACKAQSSQTLRAVCNCALASDTMKPILPPQPGTVAQYTHHIMIRIPQPAGQSSPDNSIWWPPVMEK